jgi:hypothetical protein
MDPTQLLDIINFNAIGGCIQKFPDWPSGERTANGTALCHQVQLYRYFVTQSSEFCHHNPLCCLSTSVYCCKRIFRYRLSPEAFGYSFVYATTINTRWEATQRVTVAKLTRLSHKVAIQLHLVAESCTICSSRCRRPVRKVLDTPSYN